MKQRGLMLVVVGLVVYTGIALADETEIVPLSELGTGLMMKDNQILFRGESIERRWFRGKLQGITFDLTSAEEKNDEAIDESIFVAVQARIHSPTILIPHEDTEEKKKHLMEVELFVILTGTTSNVMKNELPLRLLPLVIERSMRIASCNESLLRFSNAVVPVDRLRLQLYFVPAGD